MTGTSGLPRVVAGPFLAVAALALFFGLADTALRIAGYRPPAPSRILLRSTRSIDGATELPYMRPDPDLFWSPRPGFDGLFRDRIVRINALGCRGAEIARPKPPGIRRVLCLGDSITFGFDVGETESYPYQLGLALREQNIQVVNAGVNGYTSHQVLGRLRALAPLVEPDIVTVCVGWNDRVRLPLDDRSSQSRLRWVIAINDALRPLYLFSAMQQLYRRTLPASDGGGSVPRVSVSQYRENLGALIRECQSRGIETILIPLPHRVPAPQATYESPHGEALSAVGAEFGVPLVDLGALSPLGGQPTNGEYFLDAVHLSSRGNGYLADRLLEALRRGRLVDGSYSSRSPGHGRAPAER